MHDHDSPRRPRRGTRGAAAARPPASGSPRRPPRPLRARRLPRPLRTRCARGADLRGRIVAVAPRDRRRRHHRDPPRRRLGRPRARPVRPHRRRRRRRPPVARLLADPRPARRRPHLASPSRRSPTAWSATTSSTAPAPGTLVHLEQAAGEFVLPQPTRGKLLLRHRRLRHHPGDRHAAQPLPVTDDGVLRPRAAPTTTSSCVHVAPSRARLDLRPRPRGARRRRRDPPRRAATTTTHGVLDVDRPRRRSSPTWPSARRTPAARPACSTRSRRTTTARGLTLTTERFRTAPRRSPARAAPSPSPTAPSSRPTAPPRSSTPPRTPAS